MLGKQLQTAAAGSGAAEGLGIEDVFSTWLYTGNGSTQTITNGIDLAGEGGLVFGGHRNGTSIGNLDRFFYDTERGTGKALYPSTTSAEVTDANGISAFNSDGFTLPSGNARHNDNGYTYASWTFRKAPGFFDVVTYTGDGNASGQTINHNLGCVPGCIIVKRYDGGTENWNVYHSALGNNALMYLNTTDSKFQPNTNWNNTTPTSTTFSVRNSSVNQAGASFVAYLFAHDEAVFGENADQSVIKCGSYTGTGAAGNSINLGWEPQWILIKRSDTGGDSWFMHDNMRQMSVTDTAYVTAESTSAESLWGSALFNLSATGFQLNTNIPSFNTSGGKYIYIAIRRGPMKTPEDATTVFSANASNASAGTDITTGFPVDMQITSERNNGFLSGTGVVHDRLRGISSTDTEVRRMLKTHSTDAEFTAGGTATRDWDNTGFDMPAYPSTLNNVFWNFRRAPGFFDMVAYTGTASVRTIAHNLGVVPELVIIKQRNTSNQWVVGSSELTSWSYYVQLSASNAESVFNPAFNSTAPTDSVFTVGTANTVNESAGTFIAYLFATLPGVSKVGSYTGSSSDVQVDCGFTAGARFVLIKRTDAAGDWCVFDTARGIVSGNDPLLKLNGTSAEDTGNDLIDPLSSGFTVVGGNTFVNGAGRSYIFLAIA